MIREFKDHPVRDTGVVNKGMFEQVKMLHSRSPEAAGELAISLIELVLTGDYSSDDFMVDFAIANHKIIVEKNQEKYDNKVESKREYRKTELKLEEIAAMLNQGMKQKDIAAKLATTQGNISKRIAIIRTEYPELLLDENSKYSKNSSNDNVNVNVNDNVNVDDFSRTPCELGETPKPPKSSSKPQFEF